MITVMHQMIHHQLKVTLQLPQHNYQFNKFQIIQYDVHQ